MSSPGEHAPDHPRREVLVDPSYFTLSPVPACKASVVAEWPGDPRSALVAQWSVVLPSFRVLIDQFDVLGGFQQTCLSSLLLSWSRSRKWWTASISRHMDSNWSLRKTIHRTAGGISFLGLLAFIVLVMICTHPSLQLSQSGPVS